MIVHVCSITLRNNIANPLPPVRVFRVSCGGFGGGGAGASWLQTCDASRNLHSYQQAASHRSTEKSMNTSALNNEHD